MTQTPPWQSYVTCVDLSENVCRVASCRATLPPRRTAYCSDQHAHEFERNHVWLYARLARGRRQVQLAETSFISMAEKAETKRLVSNAIRGNVEIELNARPSRVGHPHPGFDITIESSLDES